METLVIYFSQKGKKRKKMLDNPEFDYHGILYPSLKK